MCEIRMVVTWFCSGEKKLMFNFFSASARFDETVDECLSSNPESRPKRATFPPDECDRYLETKSLVSAIFDKATIVEPAFEASVNLVRNSVVLTPSCVSLSTKLVEWFASSSFLADKLRRLYTRGEKTSFGPSVDLIVDPSTSWKHHQIWLWWAFGFQWTPFSSLGLIV